MAPPSNTPDERQTYLWGCIDKTIEIRDPPETLGLFCASWNIRREPDFILNEANGLYARVREIAQSYLRSQRGIPVADTQTHLGEEEILSQEVTNLTQHYGPAIWGQVEPGHSRSYVAPTKLPIDFDWEIAKDRDAIHFYIRCWIVRLVVEKLDLPGHKKKRKSRREESFEEGEISDSSDSSRIPHEAPEPRNTNYNGRKYNDHVSGFGNLASNVPNRGANLRINVQGEIEIDTSIKRLTPKTPNKRKALDPLGNHSTGKLQKVTKEVQAQTVPFRPPLRNPYSIPLSPEPPANEGPRNMSPEHRRRESTQDPDGLYQPPRSPTVEADTTYNPDSTAEDQSAANAADRFLQSLLQEDEEMIPVDPASPVASPSGTYRNPRQQAFPRQPSPRQDSVIPSTQPATTTIPLLEAFQVQSTPRNLLRRDSAVTNKTLSPGTGQKQTSRRELYPLLLSYLTSQNDFDPARPSHTAAELRMDTLFRQIWHADTPALRVRLGVPTFSRLDAALRSWLGMRDRLTAFQSATEYFGPPGDAWKHHLRSIVDRRKRVQACIAYNELKGWEGEVPPYAHDSFDTDLAWVFHLLTRVRGCNGVEEFEPVVEFNRHLLVWVREEEDEVDEEEVETEEEMEGLEAVG